MIGPDDALWYFTQGASTTHSVYSIVAGGSPVSKTSFTPNDVSAMTLGPDLRIWVARATQIIRMDPWTPVIQTTFTVPTPNAAVSSIVAGPDGNLWFTEKTGNKIGKVTLLGAFTEYALPVANSQPDKIAAGPDGNLWFVESTRARIGRITPAGAITEFALAAGSAPESITAGADGNPPPRLARLVHEDPAICAVAGAVGLISADASPEGRCSSAARWGNALLMPGRKSPYASRC
jgi:virginiamycin B lyase